MPYITIETFIMVPTVFKDLCKLSTAIIDYFHGHLYQYYRDDKHHPHFEDMLKDG